MSISYDQFKEVQVEKKDNILAITLNDPENGNAMGYKVIKELNEIFKLLQEDTEVRAVYWTGVGENFSTVYPGAKIHPVRKQPVHPLAGLELAGPDIHQGGAYHMIILKLLLEIPQPVVVAVRGLCTGLAANLAMCCDIVIAGEDLKLYDTHLKKGMVPGDGGAALWPLLMGPVRAKQYLFTGDTITATEAERFGLVNKVVSVEELQETGLAMARRLAEGPTLAIRFTKKAANRIIMRELDYTWEFSDALQILSTFTDDFKEYKSATKEKRTPKYNGR